MLYLRLFTALYLLAGWSHASNTITNYKCGISIFFSGADGTAYAFERWYHDSLVDDHGVFYVRDSTHIGLAHNALNTAYTQSSSTPPNEIVGVNGKDGVPNSGDEGTIRYKIDRDLQYKYSWCDDTTRWGPVLPAFTAPFALRDLQYETGVPMAGTTGDNGAAVTDKKNHYWRGIQDAYGDEWHLLTVGDDDKWIGGSTLSRYSSDGKIFYLVVNPRTPLVSFSTTTAGAQFYTTPAKTYNVPRIHAQTTYVTNGVTIAFTNIMTIDPVYYRFDTGSFIAYTGPVSVDGLADGPHTLEYYYNAAHHKTRAIVKNPAFPSVAESHGSMLWENAAEYNGIVARITSTDTTRAAFTGAYNSRRTSPDSYSGNGQAAWDAHGMKGERYQSTFALVNAFVARKEGVNAARVAGGKTYAAYAKEMLLDNWNSLDPVEHGYDQNFDPIPTKELAHFGYYQVNGMLGYAPAYDLLIGMGYTSDHQAGGITPIEDLKIRDLLAAHVLLSLRELGGYAPGTTNIAPAPDPGNGMWDMARAVGSLLAAVAMPAYHTPYYGTSGFDGTAAAYTHVPFPDQALTWKQVFVDHDFTLMSYPNCRRFFNQVEGGLVTASGDFYDRISYYSYHLMGHCFQIMANVMKIKFDHTYPYLEKSFQRANNGYLVGLKNPSEGKDSATAGGYQLFMQLVLVNEHFPAVAETAWQNLQAGKLTYNNHPMNLGEGFYSSGIYGLIWCHDDWKTVGIAAPDRTGRTTVPPSPFLGAQPCRGRLTNSWPQAIEVRSLRDELVAVLQVSESTSLMSGVYYVRSTDGKYLHKLVVIEP